MLSLQESVAIFNQENNHQDAGYKARRRAMRQFRQAYSKGQRHRFWNSLAGRPNQLRDLAEIAKAGPKAIHSLGRMSVAIDRIRGSEGRSRDFDAAFYPTSMHNEERWIGVASAQQLDVNLPPVELIQAGDVYYVRDGHHRISVARSLGQKEIEANVIAWDTH